MKFCFVSRSSSFSTSPSFSGGSAFSFFFSSVFVVVLARRVLEDGEEAGELQHFARGAEREVADGDVHVGDVEHRGLHLRGDEAVPDQLVEPVLLAGQEVLDRLGIELDRGRADGLVGVLRRLF